MSNLTAEEQQELDSIPTVSIEEAAAALAGEAYTKYREAVGGKAHDGYVLPEWQEFSQMPEKQTQVAGWLAVGNYILHYGKSVEDHVHDSLRVWQSKNS